MVYMISLHRMHGLSGAGCGGLGGALGFFRNIPLGALSWTTSCQVTPGSRAARDNAGTGATPPIRNIVNSPWAASFSPETDLQMTI